jgi:hypothetical protein
LQVKDFRFLKDSHPGQCLGVVTMAVLLRGWSKLLLIREKGQDSRRVKPSVASAVTNVQGEAHRTGCREGEPSAIQSRYPPMKAVFPK